MLANVDSGSVAAIADNGIMLAIADSVITAPTADNGIKVAIAGSGSCKLPQHEGLPLSKDVPPRETG